MFKDTFEGQTHSYNDGCGEPAHNQNPITKAHEDGERLFDKNFPILMKPGFIFEGINCTNEIKSFLATYAKMILNAAKEAGPKKVDDDGLVSTWEAGNNDCIDGFCSAIDEGIKEIKNI